MATALEAGTAYFTNVFAAGFILGTLRVLLVAPSLGETATVLLDLPVMLAVSWLACGRLLRRFRVPADRTRRLAMGLTGFGLLMAAELLLSVFAFGGTVGEHFAAYRTWHAALGLFGQLAFAAFPLLRRPGPTRHAG